MVNNRSQLKRAVDAAAVAIADEYLEGKDNFADIKDEFVYQYVINNLGMDQQLRDTVADVTVKEIETDDNFVGFVVTATFTSQQALTKFNDQWIQVSAVAEIVQGTYEVALMVDASMSLAEQTNHEFATDADMHYAILEYLVTQLLGDDDDSSLTTTESDQVYMSVVPFSNEVNLYEPKYSIAVQPRLQDWTTAGALTLDGVADVTGLVWRGFIDHYGDLSTVIYPDRRARRLSFFHGDTPLGGHEYRWEAPPTEDPWKLLALMGNSNAEANKPVASERRFFSLSVTSAQGNSHTIATNVGTPNPPLLSLTSDKAAILERIGEIKGDWQQRPMAGLVWSGAALSPDWRGVWDSVKLPLDYNLSGEEHNNKAIVILMTWRPGFAWEVASLSDYQAICQEFAERNIDVHAIIRTVSMSDLDSDAVDGFSNFFVPLLDWLTECTGGGDRLHTFETGESLDSIQVAVDEIVEQLSTDSSYVRLIE